MNTNGVCDFKLLGQNVLSYVVKREIFYNLFFRLY